MSSITAAMAARNVAPAGWARKCTAPLRSRRLTATRTKPRRTLAYQVTQEEAARIPHPPETLHALNYHHPPSQTGPYQFFMPSVSFLGPNSLAAAGKEIKKLGLKKALVVTDRALARSPAIKLLHRVLVDNQIDHALYSGVEPNPTVPQVDEGLEVLKEQGCDFLISFGGGSPHDCAKAIGILATNGGDIRDYEGVDRMSKPMLPLVSVNTTAGTAAELTRFSIISDTDRHVKMAIIDRQCTPTMAVDDPQLMLGMPKSLTAATGMDALTHAIEAYVSTASNPVTDACALHATRLICAYLRTAVEEPGNVQARDMMSFAQYLAGMAFNSASLGYVHAMAHQLGGLYGAPHGLCNAVLLPVVEEFNAQACPELFEDLAEAMGCAPSGGSKGPQEAVAAVLGAIRQLAQDVGIPRNLQELGVRPEDFGVLADNAMKDACGLTNPRAPTREEVVGMYRRAYEQ